MRTTNVLLSVLLSVLLVACSLVSVSEATTHTLQVKSGRIVLAKAVVDDATPYTGLYSLVVDGSERLWQQWFWYRLGPAGMEKSLESLPLTGVTPPSLASPNTLSLTYTLADTFNITVAYVLTYPAGGTARLQKNVTISNISTSDLDYHLFEYSDFDISDLATQSDNVEMFAGRVYQNGDQADGSGVVIIHESSLPPTKYDLDNNQIYLLPEMKDDTPSDLSIPQTTYGYGDDMQFAQQWDLTIPAGQSLNFTINEDLYYTKPVTAAKTHAGCVSYGGQADYTISFDNLANSVDNLSNIRIIDFLPADTVPATDPPADGATYEQASNSVSWSLPSLAAGAGQQSRQLSITVNSASDITNELLLVSDQAFPTRITDPAALCNHPPLMGDIPAASVDEGATFTYQVVAMDSDADTLSYGLNNAPDGMAISATGLISYPASVAGTYVVTVTATDSGVGNISVSKTFTLTVKKVNHPPVITSTPLLTANDYQLYTYSIAASDPDGDSLSYGFITKPQGMTITGNLVSWTPTMAQAGNQAVQIVVNDSNGQYVYQEFTIVVTHVNRPPVISTATLPPATATVGTFYSYRVVASDPDGNALSYSLTTKPAGMTIGTTGVIGWTPTADQNNQLHAVTAQVSDGQGGTASYSFSITVGTVSAQDPVITWATPAAITYGTQLSATQLNATANVPGTFAYTPAAGTTLNAGTQTLSLQFTPTDTTAYNSATASVSITVNKAAATVALSNLAQTYDGTARAATATTTPAGLSVSVTYNGSSTAPTAAGTYTVVATINDSNYSGSTTGSLVIAKATPTITWATPAPVYLGTALTSTQLNATASVAGTFVYTPAAGTVLNTAGTQTLSVAFTPNDSANYNNASATVSITVNNRQNPVITWPTPAAISYGTALSAAQLNATANVPGSFTYTPAAGSVLNAGTQTLSLQFTPTDTTAYNSATASVSITVNKAAATVALSNLAQTYDGTARAATATTTPAGLSVSVTYNGSSTAPTAAGTYTVVATINDSNYSGSTTGSLVIAKATPTVSWATPTPVYIGTALTSAQLNATASVSGSFTYTPPAGTAMNTAGAQTLAVAFTPSDSANFNSASATVTLTVNNRQNPVITWAAPAAITYGTALSVTQLNANANVPGSFTYTPAAGSVLNAGTQTLSLQFTPTDTTAYNSATASVSITVNKAAATVALSNLAQTYDGTARVATVVTSPAGLSTAITYNGSSTAPTAAGTYTVVATINDSNYSGSTTGSLVIAKATPTVSWATPTPVYIGTALTSAQLNATASVSGSFTYTPPAGTAMNTAGAQTLTVAFTPSDSANFNSASATVTLTVNNRQNPVITWTAPAAITYGTQLSATQLNATANVPGTFAYTPAAGTTLNAGTQTLSLQFTPTDTTAYNSATASVSITVNKAAATVALSNLAQTYDGTARVATVVTSPAGLSTAITYNGSSTAPTAAGTYTVVATINDSNYSGSTTGSLVIAKATPTVSWATPTPVYIGTALTSAQLNATASVSGSFTYTPPAGTAMNTAGAQTLAVAFTPSDSANFNNASATVTLTVNNRQNPVITWTAPAAITYGTQLSATQLNATANVPGTFAYTPAAGTTLNAGTQTLSLQFTPTDTTAYNSATASVSITVNKAAATVALSNLAQTYDGTARVATVVTSPAGLSTAITYNGSSTAPTAAGTYTVVATINDSNYSGSTTGSLVIAKATPTVSWATPTPVYIGTALTSAQLNATASVSGTFAYNPPAGTAMNTAGAQTLTVAFTPSDSANFNSASATVTLTVNNRQNPVITWTAPAAITYGTQLSATQLNATANVPGTFAYTPAAGTTLNAGTQTLSLQFTPTDTTAYNSATASVSITVNKAAATVALSNLAQTYDGTARVATVVTSPAGLSTAITYNGSSTAPTAAGTYTVVATINDSNYSGSTTGSLVIAKATPTVSWATPTPVYIGTALTSAQLNATASVSGSFTYTPPAGTAMNTAGAQTLAVAFTPSDSANFNSASATVTLTVNNRQNPVITWTAPAAITYGTQLSATQLNATANVPGTFAYTPAAGTTLNAGTQTLSLQFTPTDTTAYNSATASVSITVNKAAATVALSNLAQTYDGTARVATVVTSPAGLSTAITYNGSSTAPTAAGTYTVVATINDSNYSGSTTGSLVIAKATPTVSWATPTPVYIGTALTSAQLNATASVSGSFTYTPPAGTAMNTAGAQTLAVAFTPSDSANFNSASATVTLTVNNRQNPVITWTAPAAITYGTQLSATQLNATANVPGTFAYTPAAGTTLNAGTQTLSLQFTPTDTTAYNSATASVSITVNKAAATVALSNLAQTYDGTARVATVVTSPAGLSTAITYNGSSTAPTAAGTYTVVATINDSNYSGSTTGSLVIAKATPTVSWATPTPVYIGTALTSAQLNATASVSGSFTYTPPAGTAMNTAGAQTLAVAFTPSDSANFNNASATVTLTVNNRQNPVITWAAPAAITYGTALSVTQLNATANVPGSFTYTPAAGSVLNAGTQTLSLQFTPTDTTAYNSATASVSITVNKATAVINWATPVPIYIGSVLTSAQLNATANMAGTFTYVPPAGTAMNTAGDQILAVAFTPSDSDNYNISTATVTLTVNNRQNPVITWTAPAAITYGTQLSASQLNATANVPGSFTYTPAAGSVLNAGTQTLSLQFTPTDTTAYNSTSASVSITVNKATPVITWATPAAVDFGTILSALQLNAGSNIPGTFTYTPSTGTVLNISGSRNLTTNFTPIDTANYTNASASVSIIVGPAPDQPPTIAAIPNATVTAPAGFSYQVAANDPENQPLNYSLSGNPPGMSISNTGLINWDSSIAGTYVITATASDPGNLSASRSFTLTVNNAPARQAPVITSSPLTNAYEDGYYYYALTASDPNNDKLSYSLTTKPSGMTINETTGLIYWRPSDKGTYYVTAKVTDTSGLSAIQSYAVTVVSRPSNSSPRIVSTPVRNATAGTLYNYDVNATDSNGDMLYYRFKSAPTGMSIDLYTGMISWIPAPSQAGTAYITVEVVDSKGGKSTQGYFCKVSAPGIVINNPPEIISAPITSAYRNTPYAYEVKATDPDSDVIKYDLVKKPFGMTIDPDSGLITWAPSSTGIYSVTVKATDSNGAYTTQGFNITVRYSSSYGASSIAGEDTPHKR